LKRLVTVLDVAAHGYLLELGNFARGTLKFAFRVDNDSAHVLYLALELGELTFQLLYASGKVGLGLREGGSPACHHA